jgi:hypothetical protein
VNCEKRGPATFFISSFLSYFGTKVPSVFVSKLWCVSVKSWEGHTSDTRSNYDIFNTHTSDMQCVHHNWGSNPAQAGDMKDRYESRHNATMNHILTTALANMYAQRLLTYENTVAMKANALPLALSHRPALAPMQPSNSHAGSASILAACLHTMPTHSVSAPVSSIYGLQPAAPGLGFGLKPHAFSLGMSTPPNYVPSSSEYTSCSPLQQLPSLSQSLQNFLSRGLPTASAPTSSCEENSGKRRDVGVRKKKYRDRFSLEEEEALVRFWFQHRFRYSVKSKILWRLAQRNGVTDRDAISVQKHFDYILTYGRMDALFTTFRRKGRLLDIIDCIDAGKDFDVPPLPSHARRGSERAESTDDSSDGISEGEVT